MKPKNEPQAPADLQADAPGAGPAAAGEGQDLQAPGAAPAPAALGSAAGPDDLQVTLADGSPLGDDELALLGQRRRVTCLESGVLQFGCWVPVNRHYTNATRDQLDAIRDQLQADLEARYGPESGVKSYAVEVDLQKLLSMIDGTAQIPECIKRVP